MGDVFPMKKGCVCVYCDMLTPQHFMHTIGMTSFQKCTHSDQDDHK